MRRQLNKGASQRRGHAASSDHCISNLRKALLGSAAGWGRVVPVNNEDYTRNTKRGRETDRGRERERERERERGRERERESERERKKERTKERKKESFAVLLLVQPKFRPCLASKQVLFFLRLTSVHPPSSLQRHGPSMSTVTHNKDPELAQKSNWNPHQLWLLFRFPQELETSPNACFF